MRKPHVLEPTHGENRPTRLVFFDTESIPTQPLKRGYVHRLKLGVAHYYLRSSNGTFSFQSECVFTSGDEFASYLSSISYDKTLLYVIAHNVKFDILVSDVLSSLPHYDFKVSGFYIKGTTCIFRYRNKSRKITFLDNGNFFVDSLERIGKMLNYPKMTIDFTNTTDDYLLDYCRNDVTIIMKAWENWLQFLDDHDLGNFKMTLASTAFSAWRYRFMSHKVWIHNSEDHTEKERQAYHGGRVEVYKTGHIANAPIYRLDVNSMYPYVCYKHDFPCAEHPISQTPSINLLRMKLDKYACIATVTLETDEPAYPVVYDGLLPITRYDTQSRTYIHEIKKRKKILYPTGIIKTTLTTPELQYAFLKGHVQAVHWIASYQHKPLFREYIDYFYNLRLEYREKGNKVYDRICKNFGTSLYGKWGQLDIQTTRIGENPNGEINILHGFNEVTSRNEVMYKLPDGVFIQTTQGLAYHSYPCIAAHVTAYARMYLYQLSIIAKRENVYYSDTDSLICNHDGFLNLSEYVDENKLGALKIEEKMNWCKIYAPKHYETPETHKHKGISSKAETIGEYRYRQPQFSGLNRMLELGIIDGVLIEEIEKQLTLEISGGVLQPDGQVTPFRFPLENVNQPL